MEKNGTGGIRRLVKATGFSMQGLRAAFLYEQAFRQEVCLAIVLIPAGYWLGETGLERALLIASILLVMITELINSAIESIVDRFGVELHQLSGRAKDIGSAAVLLSLINVVIVWSLILFL